MNGRIRSSAVLVLMGYIGCCGVLSAAPTHPEPDAATAARTRADLARNKEALRKVLAAQAHGRPAEHYPGGGHGAAAGTNARVTHGIPGRAMVAPRAGATAAPRGASRQGPEALGDRLDRGVPGGSTPGATAKGNSAGPPNTGAAPAGSGKPTSNPPAALSRARIAPAAGTLGGALASNALTPVHRSPASPVTLGGAPVRRNTGYGAIDGNAFHHR